MYKFIIIFLTVIIGIECSIVCICIFKNGEIMRDLIYSKQYDSIFQTDFFNTFTNSKIAIFKNITMCLFVIQCFIITVIVKYKNTVKQYLASLSLEFQHLYKSSKYELLNLNKIQILLFILIFGLIISTRIFMIFRYPFNGDEALSYFSFVEKGSFITLSFYPEPNNHILYNLVCILFNQTSSNPLIVMRLPSVIINLLFLICATIYLLKKQNFNTAFIFLILAGFGFSTSIYSIHGRGYMLISFFALLSTISAIELRNHPNSKSYFIILLLTSILGGFTIPIFNYIFCGIVLYLVFISYADKNKNLAFKAIQYFIITILGWLFLYFPCLIFSGFNSLLNNKFVQPHTNYEYFFSHIIPVASVETLNYLLGTVSKGYLFMPIILFGAIYSYLKYNNRFYKNLILLTLVYLLIIVAHITLKHTFAEPRVFTMYSFILYLLLAIILSNIISSSKYKTYIMSIVILFPIISLSVYDAKMDTFYGKQYLQTYKLLENDIKWIKNQDITNVYTTSKAHFLYLQIFNKTHNSKINITYNSKIPNNTELLIIDNKTFLNQKQKFASYKLKLKHNETLIFTKQ